MCRILILGFAICLGVTIPAFGTEVSPARFFARCYQAFTGKTLPFHHPTYEALRDRTEVNEAIDACMSLLELGNLNVTGMLDTPNNPVSRQVLDALSREHYPYFANDGKESVNAPAVPLTDAFVDPLEPALLYTKILFQDLPYDQLLLSPFTVEAQRTPDVVVPPAQLNAFLFRFLLTDVTTQSFVGMPWICDLNGDGVTDSNKTGAACPVPPQFNCTVPPGAPASQCWCSSLGPNDRRCLTPLDPIYMKDVGEISGIKFIDPSHPKWNKKLFALEYSSSGRRNWRDHSSCADPSGAGFTQCPIYVHRNIGGDDYRDDAISAGTVTGVLGMPAYLTYHWGRSPYETVMGGLRTPRRLAAKAMNDLLCRKVPSLSASRLLGHVEPQSPLPFRQNSSCLSCHRTLDPFAWTYRNHVIVTPNAFQDILVFGKVKASAGLSIPYPASDIPNFNTSAPEGRLTYDGVDGTAYDIPVMGLNQLSEAMLSTTDYWACPVSRYLKFLTGYSVDLQSSQADASALSPKQWELRQFTLDTAAKFRQHRSLRRVIRSILESTFFREQFVNVGGSHE